MCACLLVQSASRAACVSLDHLQHTARLCSHCWLVQASQDSEQAAKQKSAAKEAALMECKARLLLQDKDLLGKVVTDTVANIEKKQARTYEELQAEQMEAEEVCMQLQQLPCILR